MTATENHSPQQLPIGEQHGNFGERETPSVLDWGYFAHLSIYDFACQFAMGKRFLDVGSGTGYGTSYVAEHGAGTVRGLERDANLVADLNRTYPSIQFDQCDLDEGTLPASDDSMDVIFTSNVLEHVAYVDPVLGEIRRILAPKGIAIVAIPPVNNPYVLKENAKNLFHITNLPQFVWRSKLHRFFESVEQIRHWVTPSRLCSPVELDYSNIRSVDDFTFTPCTTVHESEHSITAIFVCKLPRLEPLGVEEEKRIPESWQHLKVEAEGRQEAFLFWPKQIEDLIKWADTQTSLGIPPNDTLDVVMRRLRTFIGVS